VTPPERPVARPWLPVVSFVQTSVDLLGAVGAPPGSGHHYGAEQRAGWDRVLARPGLRPDGGPALTLPYRSSSIRLLPRVFGLT